MSCENPYHYDKIASAIQFLEQNIEKQPTLEEIAAHVHLSPFHFQRLFTAWAGISPKKFLQYLSVAYIKRLLEEHQDLTLFDAADKAGLSSTSRLHDLFIKIEAMTSAQYKSGGRNLTIKYKWKESPFGTLLVASTTIGICYLSFVDQRSDSLEELRATFPEADFVAESSEFHDQIFDFFEKDWGAASHLTLHLKGTPFQLKIWETLLKIPMGGVATYGRIAAQAGHSGASRAVGTAIGSNPVSFLVPCHRVIRSTGVIGNYRWGKTRKMAMIAWESAIATKD